MNIKKLILKTSIVTILLLALLLVLSPLIALFLSPKLSKHVYQELSFRVISGNELQNPSSNEVLIQKAIDYTRTNLWAVTDIPPYEGTPFDCLTIGIGWCDYHARVFCRLLSIKGIHARYDFLMDKDGVSPHTIAEVYLKGRWRAIDPYFSLIYYKDGKEWARLEEVTPQLISKLPRVSIMMQDKDAYNNFMDFTARIFPLPRAPTRSDDFVKDRHIFDFMADAYVNVFGLNFAYWYQDIFLKRQIHEIKVPVERLWYEARNYDLYQRTQKAEVLYREIIVNYSDSNYYDKTAFFLSLLLMRQERYEEAREVLNKLLIKKSHTAWRDYANFYLALCYEKLGNFRNAIYYYKLAREIKIYSDCLDHLRQLSG
ncbi:MAG: transglutaminase domain-containing protein [Candidatus Omnitrophota bacterium]